MTRDERPAIVLSSGGLDSTTCLAIVRAEGFGPIYSLLFDYGQRHRFELKAAAVVAQRWGRWNTGSFGSTCGSLGKAR